jgi:hypothetical protein
MGDELFAYVINAATSEKDGDPSTLHFTVSAIHVFDGPAQKHPFCLKQLWRDLTKVISILC